MGHNVMYETYPEKVNKASVQAEWDDHVRHANWQEGASGLPGSIRWIDHVCEDYEAAEQYIDAHDKGWYDQLAVKYRALKENAKPSAKLTQLQEQLKKCQARLMECTQKIHYKDVKSAYIGCKNCGSKLSTKYINSNLCPLCRADLRPESTLNTINSLKSKQKELTKKIREEELKQLEKIAEIRWLVKIEYHT